MLTNKNEFRGIKKKANLIKFFDLFIDKIQIQKNRNMIITLI